ncbi:MAG: peptidylprolyl isomerase [Pseudomonadota bacterium]
MTLRFLLLLVSLASPLLAQERSSFAPVLVVNERAITAFEISQRVRLLTVFGAAGDLEALAREQLVIDRLQLDIAARFEVQPSEEEIAAGVLEFLERRNIEPDQFSAALRQAGVAPETMDSFISAGLGWRRVVQGRFRRIATPTEGDLDAALALTNRGLRESVRLQELGIPFEERGEEAAFEIARRLSRELNGQGNFSAAVQRYSRMPSASNGGRMGWVPIERLPPGLASQLLALEVGEVTAPVEIQQGVAILKLLERRREPIPEDQAGPITVSYSQLIWPIAEGGEEAARQAEGEARRIQRETELCSDLDARAADFGIGSGRSEPTPVRALPAEVAPSLAEMDPGDLVTIRDGRGVVLLMLCDRSDQVSPEEREAIRQRLFAQRLTTLGQGYLADLRGSAVIEER